MSILVAGLNHKRTPVELREKLTATPETMASLLEELRAHGGLREAAVVSTCNRFEVYGILADEKDSPDHLLPFFANTLSVEPASLAEQLYVLTGATAVDHLFEVTCGLDSMVFGETQVFGQVKAAYRLASESGSTGKMLSKLFHKAFEVGKRVHTETGVGRSAVSVASAAVDLARKIFGSLEGRSVLLLGSGKMARLTAHHLLDSGVQRIAVSSRTPQNALNLAEELHGDTVPFDEVHSHLVDVDVLVASTSAHGVVLDVDQVRSAMEARRQKPLFIIDIAVPRDVDSRVNALDNAYLYDIDDLQSVVERNTVERKAQAEAARAIIRKGREDYMAWARTLRAVPIIDRLRHKANEIVGDEIRRVMNRLEGLDEHQRDIVRASLRSTCNRLLHDPTINLKELTSQGGCEPMLDLAIQLFGLAEPGAEGDAPIPLHAKAPEESADQAAECPVRDRTTAESRPEPDPKEWPLGLEPDGQGIE